MLTFVSLGCPQIWTFSMVFAEPNERLTLAAVAEHTWVIGEDGPIPQYLCWCKRKNLPKEESDGSNDDTLHNPNWLTFVQLKG